MGNVGSLPSSTSISNWTCFIGFLWLGQGLFHATPYSWTPRPWPVASSLTYGDRVVHTKDQILGYWEMKMRIVFSILVRGFGTTLIYFCTSIGNIASVTQTILGESLLLAIWQSPVLVASQRGSEFMKLSPSGASSTSWGSCHTWCSLLASPSPSFAQLLPQFSHAFVLLTTRQHTGS